MLAPVEMNRSALDRAVSATLDTGCTTNSSLQVATYLSIEVAWHLHTDITTLDGEDHVRRMLERQMLGLHIHNKHVA